MDVTVRNRVLALAAGALCLAPALAQPPKIGVDPRIELTSILFRLAGNSEYSQGRIPGYIKAIDAYFEPYRTHEAVEHIRSLRSTGGVSFDAVPNLAIRLKDVETLAERIPFDKPESKLDRRWKGEKSREFLAAARRFVADTKFTEFLKSQQPLFDATNERLKNYVGSNADLGWYDRFFGARPKARFYIVPGLTNGGSSYGTSLVAEDGVEEIYAIPGVWQVDPAGLPFFGPGFLDTLVHEFVHSYSNPLVDEFAERMLPAGTKLWEPVKTAMSRQAYGTPKTLLYESMVRAATARYILEHQGEDRAGAAVRNEQNRSFLWTGELVELLGEYEKDREKYPTLKAFMPRVAEFFDRTAARISDIVEKYEARRPKVASISIANGARDIDPALKEIVVRFDRPMRTTSYAVGFLNRDRYPKTGRLSWDETGKVFTIPVTLEPARDYEFTLNWPGGGSFAAEDGVLLGPVEVRFRTKDAKTN